MYTTGLVAQTGEHVICLYRSGRAHAGDNLTALLGQRATDRGPPIVMSDALAANQPAADDTVIRCHCLAHGRRQFTDLEDVFPAEARHVITVLNRVFEHEAVTRTQAMTPAARLAYHRTYSGPLLAALHAWLEQQLQDRTVEPNGSLGKAFFYLLRHWRSLTQFLRVPGAPLDNNTVERALKRIIRQRNNSLFYASAHSATVASILTSLVATCVQAGVNALDYWVALPTHRSAVFRQPAAWLPWNYHENVAPAEATRRQSAAIAA